MTTVKKTPSKKGTNKKTAAKKTTKKATTKKVGKTRSVKKRPTEKTAPKKTPVKKKCVAKNVAMEETLAGKGAQIVTAISGDGGLKTVWKPFDDAETISVDEYERWLTDMKYEPYLYDPFLQAIPWVKNLTQAIKKVEPVVGEGDELEYMYWEDLSGWQFILNSFSIARAIDLHHTLKAEIGWQQMLSSFKMWVDSASYKPRTSLLFQSGTHFFYDMIRFFADNRQFSNPDKLSESVLSHD